MNQMAKEALEQDSDLKLIMKGEVDQQGNQKLGVTSVILISKDKEKVKKVFLELCEKDPDSFYMIYSVNLDVRLDHTSHYPSIAISQEDLTV